MQCLHLHVQMYDFHSLHYHPQLFTFIALRILSPRLDQGARHFQMPACCKYALRLWPPNRSYMFYRFFDGTVCKSAHIDGFSAPIHKKQRFLVGTLLSFGEGIKKEKPPRLMGDCIYNCTTSGYFQKLSQHFC